MDSSLNEDDIQLLKKIHDAGFLNIRQGKLVGDKLLEFLANEEAVYNQRQIKSLT